MERLRYNLPASKRLRGRRAFAAVYDARMRKNVGPLTVCGLPNQLPHCRMGLSVSRRVGNAVKRNRIKRLLREAYRLEQHDLPAGYDLVVVVRPHVPVAMTDYRRMLVTAVKGVEHVWRRRLREERPLPPPETSQPATPVNDPVDGARP